MSHLTNTQSNIQIAFLTVRGSFVKFLLDCPPNLKVGPVYIAHQQKNWLPMPQCTTISTTHKAHATTVKHTTRTSWHIPLVLSPSSFVFKWPLKFFASRTHWLSGKSFYKINCLNTKKSTQIETDPSSFSDSPMWTRSCSIDFVPNTSSMGFRHEIWID